MNQVYDSEVRFETQVSKGTKVMKKTSGLNFNPVSSVDPAVLAKVRAEQKNARDTQLAHDLVACENVAQASINQVVKFLQRLRKAETALSSLLKDCRTGNVDAFEYQTKLHKVICDDKTGLMHRQITTPSLPFSKEHFES